MAKFPPATRAIQLFFIELCKDLYIPVLSRQSLEAFEGGCGVHPVCHVRHKDSVSLHKEHVETLSVSGQLVAQGTVFQPVVSRS